MHGISHCSVSRIVRDSRPDGTRSPVVAKRGDGTVALASSWWRYVCKEEGCGIGTCGRPASHAPSFMLMLLTRAAVKTTKCQDSHVREEAAQCAKLPVK